MGQNEPPRHMPQIAVVTNDTLTAIGLRSLICTMMPGVEVHTYGTCEDLLADQPEQYAHYFVSTTAFMAAAPFFRERLHQTFVLVHGNDIPQFPSMPNIIDISLPEPQLVRALLRLEQKGHGPHTAHAGTVCEATGKEIPLTPREREVLALVVTGLLNKEIAERLHISLTTVITHRKNLTGKLGIKSVSALTIYAVMHGLVKLEDI